MPKATKKRKAPAKRKRRRLPETPADLSTMGGRIRDMRVRHDMSQTELARRLGVDRSAVAQWELGYTGNIKNTTLIKIRRLFGVTDEYIVLGLPPEKTKS